MCEVIVQNPDGLWVEAVDQSRSPGPQVSVASA